MAAPPTPAPVLIDDILVVASTDSLRASLRFLLEEENYRVTTAASIEDASTLTSRFACTVVDHHAFRQLPGAELAAFIHGHWPVVLLATGTPGVLLPISFRVVTMPLLGAALSHAVREAVMHSAAAADASTAGQTFK